MSTNIEMFKSACENGDLVTVSELFEYVNGNVNMLEMRNLVAESGNLNILEFLHKKGVNINELYYHKNPLMIAAALGWIDIIDYLLNAVTRQEVDINLQENIGKNTALMFAAAYGKTDVVDRLLQNEKCRINISNNYGDTAIFWSAQGGYLNILDKLIINGSNIWHVNKYGGTLLHYAVRSTNPEVLKRLLSFGLDINYQDSIGNTPLVSAVYCDRKKMVEILLQYGADTRIKTNCGKTASDYATNEEIKELLNRYSS